MTPAIEQTLPLLSQLTSQTVTLPAANDVTPTGIIPVADKSDTIIGINPANAVTSNIAGAELTTPVAAFATLTLEPPATIAVLSALTQSPIPVPSPALAGSIAPAVSPEANQPIMLNVVSMATPAVAVPQAILPPVIATTVSTSPEPLGALVGMQSAMAAPTMPTVTANPLPAVAAPSVAVTAPVAAMAADNTVMPRPTLPEPIHTTLPDMAFVPLPTAALPIAVLLIAALPVTALSAMADLVRTETGSLSVILSAAPPATLPPALPALIATEATTPEIITGGIKPSEQALPAILPVEPQILPQPIITPSVVPQPVIADPIAPPTGGIIRQPPIVILIKPALPDTEPDDRLDRKTHTVPSEEPQATAKPLFALDDRKGGDLNPRLGGGNESSSLPWLPVSEQVESKTKEAAATTDKFKVAAKGACGAEHCGGNCATCPRGGKIDNSKIDAASAIIKATYG